MTDVAVVRGENRRENLEKALGLLSGSVWEKLGSAKTVLIKPNLVHHKNQLASTHIDAVRGVIEVIRKKCQAPIVVADSGYHGTKAAFKAFGYENLLNEFQDIELFDLNDDDTRPGYFMKRDGSKGEMGISARVLDADFTVCLTQMKMHRDTGVTLTMKNWTIGTWVPEARFGPAGKYWPRWPFLHEEGPFAHQSTIAELLHQHAPDLSVIDGFLAMEGDGPTRGEAVEMGVALAGADSLAVDTIGAKLMGLHLADIGHLAMARERGYGVGDETAITILGETDLDSLTKTFEKPETWDDHVLAWKSGPGT